MNPRALVKRTFKYKKSTMKFLCPLCGTERAFTLKPQIRLINYLHMLMITVVIVMALYPWMGLKSAWLFFMVWGIYECVLRMLFRKQVPCPHCGFDASWYQKDVKVARQKVEEFWQLQGMGTAAEATMAANLEEGDYERTPERTAEEIAPYLN